MADDVLVEDRDVVEPLQQVERDVRLPFLRRAANVAKVVVDAQRLDFVAHRRQRRDDVVLGAPGHRGDIGSFLDCRRRDEMAMHQCEDAQVGHRHNATR